jgi:hypothetical protein
LWDTEINRASVFSPKGKSSLGFILLRRCTNGWIKPLTRLLIHWIFSGLILLFAFERPT